MWNSRLLSPVLLILIATSSLGQAATTVYVSSTGSDSNTGEYGSPKQSIYGAVDAVRSARRAGSTNQFIVQFASGVYYFDRAMILESTDRGATGAPLIFKGETKDVYFDGSRAVTGWQRVSGPVYERLSVGARDKIFVAPIPLNGSTPMDVGVMNRRGAAHPTGQTWSTLVFNGSAMTLARHPNAGWLTIPSGHDGSFTSFGVSDPAPFSWQNTGDIWTYGFFNWDWADSFEKVLNFDSSSAKVNLTTTPHYGIKKNQRYMFVNAIEALDEAGEYFVDRAASVVYFYPPLSGLTDTRIAEYLNVGTRLTALDANLVEVNSAQDVTFENITFQNGRRSGVLVRYGSRIAFKGCTFRRFNYHGAVVVNGQSHLFLSCNFYDLDEAGVTITGGDRVNLTSSGHLIQNCHFRDYAKLCRAYRPAIDVWGVGSTIRNCRMENAPHSGVILRGNNQAVEKSEFVDLCRETSDAGAIYIGRNPTFQGNRVTNNRFQDIWTRISGNYSNFTAGVYMDDMVSGLEVHNNLFKNVQIGAVVGGGSDINLNNNYFISNGKSVHFDARGTSWASDFMTRWNVPGMLSEVPYQQSPWTASYQYLPYYFVDQPERPKRDTLTHSVSVGNADWLLLLDNLTTSSDPSTNPQILAANNVVSLTDPGFVDMANENFAFQSGSVMASLGIAPLDTSVIGLYTDIYRSVSTTTPPPPEPSPDVDGIPPSMPSGLGTTSGSRTGQVTLKWSGSTDNSGTVVRYDVYRSSKASGSYSFLASAATTSFTDSAGRGKTRYYYVVAVDPSGNRSVPSNIAKGVGKR